MEAFKKQAAKLREQVAKQQQAVMKHLGHFGHDSVVLDEAEQQCYKQLQNLYNSTRAAKHLQKNIVRGVEGYISVGLKQMDIARKLAADCSKYGAEGQCTDPHVSKAVSEFGDSHTLMEDEAETLLGVLSGQVSEPIRALITGAPLEDARHLVHRYDKLRQEVEAQAADVMRRRSKTKDSDITAENSMKLRSAETRLTELKSSMVALGREATDAMLSVENQQQEITTQRLFAMVDAERCYHRHVLDTLEKLYAEMISAEQLYESTSQTTTIEKDMNVPSRQEKDVNVPSRQEKDVNAPPRQEYTITNGTDNTSPKDALFIAKVVHQFDAQAEGELNLCIDDYVIVRQVASTGWSEGECRGKAGWFPSAYVEKDEKAPANMLLERGSPKS
ncbi:SH3 domain-containing protein 1 [Linum grandiflorum]